MLELKGVIKLIKDEEVISDKFKKREFVIETEGEYPQSVMFQTTQAKTEILDKFGEGQQVNVRFNLRGREWTSPQGEVKYFNTLDAYRIEALSTPQSNKGDIDLAF